MRYWQRATGLVAGVLFLAGLSACSSDSTGLDSEFDPQSTAESIDALGSVVEGNRAILHLGLAGQALAGGGVAASVESGLLPRMSRERLLDDYELYRSVAATAGSAPIFPANWVGKTFVWDPDQEKYVLDEQLSGAPANGIRFLLYVLGEDQLPATPLQVAGTLDLLDESGPSSTRLAVLAVDTSGPSDVTLLSYFIDGSFTLTEEEIGVTFASEGFVADGSAALEFALSESIGISGALNTVSFSISHELSAPSMGVVVSLQLNGEAGQGNEGVFTIGLFIEDGPDRAALNVTVQDELIDGTVSHNLQTVLLISGAADNPTFSLPDGSPPTAADLAALGDIWQAVQDVLEFTADLLQPLAELFGVDVEI
jgi:hypothetical protein